MKRSKFDFISIAAACIAWNSQRSNMKLCASMSPSVGWTVTLWECAYGDWYPKENFYPCDTDKLFDFIYGEK